MKDLFANQSSSLTSPFTFAESVVPSDVNDVNFATRALYVGVAGDVRIATTGGSIVTFRNHPVGYLPARITRVYAAGTTATQLVAVW